MVLPPQNFALGLKKSRLASLHILSLGLRVRCKGFPTVVNRLATRLVHHWEPLVLHWEFRPTRRLARKIYYAYMHGRTRIQL
jgi:hypothetical protein